MTQPAGRPIKPEGAAFTGLLIKNGIAIGMDGKVHGETPSSSRGCAQRGSGPTRAFRDY